MRKREDYSRLLALALVFSVGILVAFQLYILREPGRISNVLAGDQAEQVSRGQQLFSDNCTTCHGDNGEGGQGPALNSKTFLKSVDDGQIFSIISTGVPGTAMPTWSQAHGGPFTDEQVRDLVSYLRHWEPTAPDLSNVKPTPDVTRGQEIFASTCYACHGDHGQGTKNAPALNSAALLSQFDDNWFHQTIAQGRPAQGMPTWGTVLSPEEIDDVVAFIRTWRAAPAVVTPTMAVRASPQPAATAAATAVALATPAATPTTAPASPTTAPAATNTYPSPSSAAVTASPAATSAPTVAPTASGVAPTSPAATTAEAAAPTAPAATEASGGEAVLPNCGNANCATPGAAITQNLKGDPARGAQLFVANCQKCHGAKGTGGKSNPGSTDGTIPPLNPIDPAIKGNSSAQFALTVDLFVEHGSTPDGPSPANVMVNFGDGNKLTPQQIADLIAYVQSLNQ